MKKFTSLFILSLSLSLTSLLAFGDDVLRDGVSTNEIGWDVLANVSRVQKSLRALFEIAEQHNVDLSVDFDRTSQAITLLADGSTLTNSSINAMAWLDQLNDSIRGLIANIEAEANFEVELENIERRQNESNSSYNERLTPSHAGHARGPVQMLTFGSQVFANSAQKFLVHARAFWFKSFNDRPKLEKEIEMIAYVAETGKFQQMTPDENRDAIEPLLLKELTPFGG